MNSSDAEEQFAGQLDYRGSVFINFKNNTFQWVDIQRFRLPAGATDQEVLALLIEHDLYGCDYAGGDPGEDPTRHGPYRRERINPDAFDPTDAAAEEARLRAWTEQHAEVPEHLHADLDRELYGPLHTTDSIYRLCDLSEASFHDRGGVHNDFHELVLINRTSGVVALMVAADD